MLQVALFWNRSKKFLDELFIYTYMIQGQNFLKNCKQIFVCQLWTELLDVTATKRPRFSHFKFDPHFACKFRPELMVPGSIKEVRTKLKILSIFNAGISNLVKSYENHFFMKLVRPRLAD
jgi:hypothetical protein